MAYSTPKVVGSIEHKEIPRDKDTVVIQATWTIPTYRDLFRENTSEIQSPRSFGPTFCKFQFRIQFCRRFISHNDENKEIHIFFKLSQKVFLESIELTKSWPESESMTIWPQSIVEANKWRSFIREVVTMDQNKRVNFDTINLRPESNVQLCFKFVVSKKVEVPETQLSNDFGDLLQTGLLSDVVMKSVEDEEFRVHKAVLASRSAVLKARFEHDTAETITNIVDSPLESEVLREVLSFVYTDKAPKMDEIPEKLLAAADYYQLSRLKSLCEEALYKKLNVNNAIEILQLADLHSANTLKQLSLDFIKEDFGKLKLITKTEGWAKLESVHLLKNIYE